ncbi:VOC family protein [Neobacillus mesonae]|nr:VOC family protein [Neobacillus mesonae]
MTYSIDQATSLGEVKLRVSELSRSITFYEQVVGLKLLSRNANLAVLTADGVKPLVILEELENVKPIQPRSHAGLYHFAILLPDRKSLGLALRNLIDRGMEIGQGDHSVSEALYINDPDGHGIEIYADRTRSVWKKDENNHYIMGTDAVDVRGLLDLAGEEPFTGLPDGTIIGHVHFHISDLATARRFYNELLGFDIVLDDPRFRAVFVSAGGYHHHIGLNIWAGQNAPATPQDAVGIDYFTIVFDNKNAYDETLARLQSSGYSITNIDGEAYVNDPFSIRIRMIHK